MPAVIVVGSQWGDEGKGKITDYLAQHADMVVRYQGGNNAGHTLVVQGSVHKLHMIPSGILHPHTTCVLGNGVVVDPDVLALELDTLQSHAVETARLRISKHAHFILPTHKILDRVFEARKGSYFLGTTGRGIGPAYWDKVHRCGIRLADPAHPPTLAHQVDMHLQEHAGYLENTCWDASRLTSYVSQAYQRLASHLCDTSILINAALDQGKRVLFEGAQGTLLDLDHGTYPFVTSSNPTAGGACVGSGIGPMRINRVVGVFKAYTTRVGRGPFPTELSNPLGAYLRTRGREFGTTTARPRRCGWLDLVALRYAVRINGMTHLALTKLDVLDGRAELKLCTAYRSGADLIHDFPTDEPTLTHVAPVYQTLPGWNQSTSKARTWLDLPSQARQYISHIEDAVHVPISLISIGAERHASLDRLKLWEGV